MNCCGGGSASQTVISELSDEARDDELFGFGKMLPDGTMQYVFSSSDIHCGGCISILEEEIGKIEGVISVRVNLTLKRISVNLKDADVSPLVILNRMAALGYVAIPIDIDDQSSHDRQAKDAKLLRALAVAGFGAMNIMLLSISTWSGANGSAKTLFHLISAVIAIPTVLYAGQIFFLSALKVLKNGHLNMDVPISLAVLLALGMSVFEALTHGDVVYFDASVSLLFFLLIGRYLDHMMREKARNAVNTLARRQVKGATIVLDDGETSYLPIDEIKQGMILRILPGDKIPVDSRVIKGTSDVDFSLVTGESLPVAVACGTTMLAGTLNVSGVIDVEVTKIADQSFLAEIARMLDAAENGRGAYVRIADRMAKIYAPAVHLLALIGFIVWMIITGGDWHTSIYIAISILIITCPCALGLAVPVVHVIGAGRLFDAGILMKDGAALERLAEVNYAVFDKTGTLTSDKLTISGDVITDPSHAPLIKALAQRSNHPSSQALARYLKSEATPYIDDVKEYPGFGLEGIYKGKRVRLGSYDWVTELLTKATADDCQTGDVHFSMEGSTPSSFSIEGQLRTDAAETISALEENGLPVEILSGDNSAAVIRLAQKLGISSFRANAKPQDKIEHIQLLKAQGKSVLMIGDGINDAPSLAAGHASMAPASASDVGRSAADFVFTRNNLSAILFAIDIARRSGRLIKQNFGLALVYNMIAVPLAFMGFITPLFAAIAMSASSMIVILNSMRLVSKGGLRHNIQNTRFVLEASS